MSKQQRTPPDTSFLCLSCFSITRSFILAALVAVMCHVADPSVQIALLAIVHYNQLLVWFKASGLQYTNNTGHALILLLGILLLPGVKKILQLWFYRTSFFMCSIDEVGQHRVLDMILA